MVLPRGSEMKTAAFLLGVTLLSIGAECVPLGADRGPPEAVFDVTAFGAKPDGRTESNLAIIKAFQAACAANGPSRVIIPLGNFMVGELLFEGKTCTSRPITIDIRGTLLARSDLTLFANQAWIILESVDSVIITGGGTLNARGEFNWRNAVTGTDIGRVGAADDGRLLPISLLFTKAKNSAVSNIGFVNSKGFHIKITDSIGITVSDFKITAPFDSPNTDGLHISDSANVTVTNGNIGTGDDCISVGDGNTDVAISKITCGPGHGISIGSLGKRIGEQDLKGVTITNCTLTGTSNGARIKTYRDSPRLVASGIVFDDIVMNQVKNPIVIDQNYNSRDRTTPSNVKLMDIHFKNIRGTSTSAVPLALNCSEASPCEGVELSNIFLGPAGPMPPLVARCSNARILVTGQVFPLGC